MTVLVQIELYLISIVVIVWYYLNITLIQFPEEAVNALLLLVLSDIQRTSQLLQWMIISIFYDLIFFREISCNVFLGMMYLHRTDKWGSDGRWVQRSGITIQLSSNQLNKSIYYFYIQVRDSYLHEQTPRMTSTTATLLATVAISGVMIELVSGSSTQPDPSNPQSGSDWGAEPPNQDIERNAKYSWGNKPHT